MSSQQVAGLLRQPEQIIEVIVGRSINVTDTAEDSLCKFSYLNSQGCDPKLDKKPKLNAITQQHIKVFGFCVFSQKSRCIGSDENEKSGRCPCLSQLHNLFFQSSHSQKKWLLEF